VLRGCGAANHILSSCGSSVFGRVPQGARGCVSSIQLEQCLAEKACSIGLILVACRARCGSFLDSGTMEVVGLLSRTVCQLWSRCTGCVRSCNLIPYQIVASCCQQEPLLAGLGQCPSPAGQVPNGWHLGYHTVWPVTESCVQSTQRGAGTKGSGGMYDTCFAIENWVPS